jgi:hypothetical protein
MVAVADAFPAHQNWIAFFARSVLGNLIGGPHRRRDDALASFDHRASQGPPRRSTAASKRYLATPSARDMIN